MRDVIVKFEGGPLDGQSKQYKAGEFAGCRIIQPAMDKRGILRWTYDLYQGDTPAEIIARVVRDEEHARDADEDAMRCFLGELKKLQQEYDITLDIDSGGDRDGGATWRRGYALCLGNEEFDKDRSDEVRW